MEFSTSISAFDSSYNFNAIDNYNKFLNNNDAFKFDENNPTEFEQTLEQAKRTQYINDKNDPTGLGNFASQIGNAFSSGLNSVNNLKMTADRMQEDIAMGGPTSVHDAMIAAEKAQLSMQMAVQVRNRILSAYTELTSMGI